MYNIEVKNLFSYIHWAHLRTTNRFSTTQMVLFTCKTWHMEEQQNGRKPISSKDEILKSPRKISNFDYHKPIFPYLPKCLTYVSKVSKLSPLIWQEPCCFPIILLEFDEILIENFFSNLNCKEFLAFLFSDCLFSSTIFTRRHVFDLYLFDLTLPVSSKPDQILHLQSGTKGEHPLFNAKIIAAPKLKVNHFFTIFFLTTLTDACCPGTGFLLPFYPPHSLWFFILFYYNFLFQTFWFYQQLASFWNYFDKGKCKKGIFN